MARIAHGGFLHETNTFAPVRAEFRHFEQGEGWPGLTRGADILDVFPAINIGTGGFIPRAQALGHELAPLAWAAAVPSSYVTDDAYETVVAILLEDLERALGEGIDGIYLDLHGAMVVESYEDGEGELLRRVRALTGPDMPLVVSLDLHANVTEAMVFHADALIAYRTYPHLDMAETGDRAARHLDALLKGRKEGQSGGQSGSQNGGRPRQARAFRKLPFLYGLTSQCTMLDPSKGVYEELEAIEADMAGAGVSVLSYTPGFPPADIRDCGPAVLAYADTPAAADAAADRLAGYILEREQEFAAEMLSPDEAVRRAMAAPPGKPTVLADFQDNSGAGATSDTTGLLAALVRNGAEGAVLGLLTDPGAAAAAHEAGEGAEVVLDVGGKIFLEGDPPFRATFAVERVSDGRFLCTGPFYGGTQADLGPTALLRVAGSDVRVIVTSGRMQAADKEMFRHIGVEPAEQRILGLKSSVHFRGDFTDIAREILLVEAPGAFIDRPERLPYRNLREGVRLCPGGPEFRRPA